MDDDLNIQFPDSPSLLNPLDDARHFAFLVHTNPGGSTTNNPLEITEGILNFGALITDIEFPNSLIMPGASHLEDINGPRHLTPNFDILQQQNRVCNGRNVGLRNGMGTEKLIGGIREKPSDFFLFSKASHPNHKLPEGVIADPTGQGRQGVYSNPAGFEV
jgi:hypothetical protein